MGLTYDHFPQVIVAVKTGSDEISKNVAEAIAEYARILVPVRTGALKISIDVSGGGNSYEVSAESTAGGAPREYAGYVEYGTSRMAAQPYMHPAYIMGKDTRLPIEEAKYGAKIEAAAGG